MDGKKKMNWWIIVATLLILLAGGYYSYLSQQEQIDNGVYTIARVDKIRPARNGWKIRTTIEFRNIQYQYDGLLFWEHFSVSETHKRFFAKILDYDPESGYSLIPTIPIPDSIKSAPADGWSEGWMREHFPEVVAYVHDAK